MTSPPEERPPVPGLSYKDAGVDIDAMDKALARIRSLARETNTDGVLSDIGGFGGLFRAPEGGEQVLVSSVDGVGTKLRVALDTGVHDTVGEDLVNHCINDILVQGGRPLFFMDYLATGRLHPSVVVSVVEGIARACRQAGCALLGGETAEMPGFYGSDEYDVAGFIVGAVPRSRLLTGAEIRPGDRLLGLTSTGLHTNGYSLARKIIFECQGLLVSDPFPGENASVGKVLLRTHRSYLSCLGPLLDDGLIRGLAHITGGGTTDNLPRILPADCRAEINRDAWPVPNLFARLQEWGGVTRDEMDRTFNMGIGMVVVVAPDLEEKIVARLQRSKETVYPLGCVLEGEPGVTFTEGE